MIIYSLSLFLFQELPKLMPTPEPSSFKVIMDTIGSIATPVGVVALLVAFAYFFWHSKNREELTKALAEASSLADTRGKRIADLNAEIVDKDLLISKKDALLLAKDKEIADLELDDERRAKTEFRLRGEIAELERKLGIQQHGTN